ncbi:MAG TPA: hypothetical protein VKV30_00750 [Candidatus Angelobacter sp.]|nr:hypothetical protein [Candidatus Angelobacter sp.]
MDSWMPWTITRNFIRAFFLTLLLLIAWDFWRNLGHSASMQRQTLLIDAIAFCTILAIRLQPPLAPAWEQLKYPFAWKQLKYPFRLSWMGILGVVGLLMALMDPDKLSFLTKGPLTVVGYIFYCDLSRTCKISLEDAEKHVDLVHTLVGVSGWIIWSIASSIGEMGRFSWRDVLFLAIFFLVLIGMSAFKWWGEWDGPISHIQELGLNREFPGGPNP